jgi:hypothetical protein
VQLERYPGGKSYPVVKNVELWTAALDLKTAFTNRGTGNRGPHGARISRAQVRGLSYPSRWAGVGATASILIPPSQSVKNIVKSGHRWRRLALN